MVDENPIEDLDITDQTTIITPTEDPVESPIVKTYTEWLTPEEIATRKREAEIAELMLLDNERLDL